MRYDSLYSQDIPPKKEVDIPAKDSRSDSITVAVRPVIKEINEVAL